MTRWHNHYVDGMIHFCTSTVQNWQPRLDDHAAVTIYREWNLTRKKLDVRVIAYVVMPDHIHLLLWSELGKKIQEFLQQTLSNSSKRIAAGGKLWKERPRVVPVYSSYTAKTKLNYIHNNPVKRKLSENPEDWVHSSFSQIVMEKSDTPFRCDPWPDMFLQE